MSAEIEQYVDRYGQPLRNSPYVPDEILEVDVDGDGKVFSDLGGLEIGYKTTREICFGIRTGSKAGCGSWDDPYNFTSSTDFAAKLAATAGNTKRVIRLRDGEFPWMGYYAGQLQTQDWIIGAGRDATILKLDPAAGPTISGSIAVLSNDNATNGNGIRVEDLTVDCNYQNLTSPTPGTAVHGVYLFGDRNIIRNVRAINSYGDWTSGSEAFGLICEAHVGGVGIGNRIEHSIVEQFRGNYGNGICMAGQSGAACIGSLVSHCIVKGYKAYGVTTVVGSHVTGIGIGGGAIEHCLLDGCHYGIYIEQGADLALLFNQIRDCHVIGIHLSPVADILRPRLIGNWIEMRDDSDGYRWGIALTQSGAYRVREAIVAFNSVRQTVTGNTPGDPTAYYGLTMAANETGTAHTIIHNKFDDDAHFNAWDESTYRHHNTGHDGALLPDIPDSGAIGRVSAHASGNQTIATGTATKLLFQSEEYDTGACFASSRYTARKAGYIRLRALVTLVAANANASRIDLYRNGTPYIQQVITRRNTAADDQLPFDISVPTAAGAYWELFGQHDAGADRVWNLTNTASLQIEEEPS